MCDRVQTRYDYLDEIVKPLLSYITKDCLSFSSGVWCIDSSSGSGGGGGSMVSYLSVLNTMTITVLDTCGNSNGSSSGNTNANNNTSSSSSSGV